VKLPSRKDYDSESIPTIRYLRYDYLEKNLNALDAVLHLQDVLVNFADEIDKVIYKEKRKRNKEQKRYPMFSFACRTLKSLAERGLPSSPVDITILFLLGSHFCIIRESDQKEVSEVESVVAAQSAEQRSLTSCKPCKAVDPSYGEIVEKDLDRLCRQCENWERHGWKFLCCSSCGQVFCSEICFREFHVEDSLKTK